MAQFKVGDRVEVLPNEFNEYIYTNGGQIGVVNRVHYDYGDIRHYKITWDNHFYGWDETAKYWPISEKVLKLIAPAVVLTQQERVINKIRYLDKKWADKMEAKKKPKPTSREIFEFFMNETERGEVRHEPF